MSSRLESELCRIVEGGTRSATGAPLTVMVTRSPRATRCSTSAVWFRKSLDATVLMLPNVALLPHHTSTPAGGEASTVSGPHDFRGRRGSGPGFVSSDTARESGTVGAAR